MGRKEARGREGTEDSEREERGIKLPLQAPPALGRRRDLPIRIC